MVEIIKIIRMDSHTSADKLAAALVRNGYATICQSSNTEFSVKVFGGPEMEAYIAPILKRYKKHILGTLTTHTLDTR